MTRIKYGGYGKGATPVGNPWNLSCNYGGRVPNYYKLSKNGVPSGSMELPVRESPMKGGKSRKFRKSRKSNKSNKSRKSIKSRKSRKKPRKYNKSRKKLRKYNKYNEYIDYNLVFKKNLNQNNFYKKLFKRNSYGNLYLGGDTQKYTPLDLNKLYDNANKKVNDL